MVEYLDTTFVLAVNDLAVSRAFFMDCLGFEEDLAVEGWSFLSRGQCQVRMGHCPGIEPMSRVSDHSWIAYWRITGAREHYHELVSKGVSIWHPLQDKPWGMREFAIVTPDGHRIVFGEELENCD